MHERGGQWPLSTGRNTKQLNKATIKGKDTSNIPKYITGQNADGTLPEGKYPFEVTSAKMRTSTKGSEMIEVTLEVGQNGSTVKVIDYLVFDGKPFTSGRIDQIRTSIGELILPGEEVEVLPSDLLHKTGTANLVIEEWNGRKRNKVGSYLEPEDQIPGLELAPKAKESKAQQPKSQLI